MLNTASMSKEMIISRLFEEALKDADAGSKVLYIPAGTFELSGIWYIFGSDVKITGAGMWYTNLKFTKP